MKNIDELERQRQDAKRRWAGDKRRRDISMIMHVLLTNVPSKIIATKHGLKCTGNVQDVVHRFSYRMMLRGDPQWEQWRKNRINRTEAERRQLMEVLVEKLRARQSDFEGW